MVELLLNGKPVQFKIDTGADVTAISEAIYQKLDGVTLMETSQSFHSPAKQASANNAWKFTDMLTYQQSNTCQEIFVVYKLRQAPQWPPVSVDKEHRNRYGGPGLSRLLQETIHNCLMLQRMPLIFIAFNKHRTTKLTLNERNH